VYQFESIRSANIALNRKPAPDTQKWSIYKVQYITFTIEIESLTQGFKPRFTQWARQYGGMYSLKLGPATAIVLTDRRLVKELLDRKSSIYSNRPLSYVSHDLITGGDHLLVMDYGETWRLFRKIIHQRFKEQVCETEHITLQNAEAVQLVRDLCLAPEKHRDHLHRFSNSIIMSIGKPIAIHSDNPAWTAYF